MGHTEEFETQEDAHFCAVALRIYFMRREDAKRERLRHCVEVLVLAIHWLEHLSTLQTQYPSCHLGGVSTRYARR